MHDKNISVTIVKSGVDIKKILCEFLKNVQCFEVDYNENLNFYPESDVLICSLELTHSHDIQEVIWRIKKYLEKYSVVIFCEPSSLSSKQLRQLGYKSVHTLFPENIMLDEINFDFLCNFGAENKIVSVADYGYDPSYHVKSIRLVPVENNSGIDYSSISNRPDLTINFPVFDMEVFVLSQFNAPKINLGSDLELVQYKILQPNASAGGMVLQNFKTPQEAGTVVYETSETNLKHIKEFVKSPMVLDDYSIKTSFIDKKLKEWCNLISFSYEKISIVRFDECTITGCGFLYSKKNPISKSDYLLPFLTPSIYQPIWKGLQNLHPSRSLDGPTIIAFNHLHGNYYHFLAECLQSAYLIYSELKKQGKKNINIVTCKLKGFSKEYFEMLFSCIPDLSIVELGEADYIHSSEVYYSPELLGFTTPQPCLVAERRQFRNFIMEKSNIKISSELEDIIYISRKDTKARRICNEDDLICALKNLDVKIVELTNTSVREQIKIFSNAQLVIGGHGAGISNSLFMRSGAVMLELIQASYQNVGPMRLAQSSGAQYMSMLFFEEGEGNSWYVDVEKVFHFIKQYKIRKGL
ncbi:Capsular Polysaccharide Biosynthesis Protein-Like Protein [Acetobacter malorum]|uniref:Capsular Polysaccharide Biosynthesis Protein-Like Protein n=1 Tax=Acetobacter malorum TaxID=178901 RepID=A0A177G874_9PROT|nr:glycosyltransferase family 61 protein [Acetobacter malorum]OAG75565.1 Capsular Polysaccharide Biosynthesis Protein-Like Protein [Acetobacter malorum]